MKTITIELPDDADIKGAILAAQNYASPDCINITWHIEDVQSLDGGSKSDLTDEECREVLRLAYPYHGRDGVCWNALAHYIKRVKAKRKQGA